MSDNKLTVFGGSFPAKATASLAGALTKSSQKNPRSGDGSYLNFSGKLGMYQLGIDGSDLTGDELFMVNIAGFEEGYICWKGGKPEATRLGNISDEPIETPDPQEFGPFTGSDGWSSCKAMTVKDLSTGTQYQFKTNSVSGLSVFAEFTSLIGARAGNGEASWPIVSFGKTSFTAGGNKNYKPVIDVDGWISDEHLAAIFDEGSEHSLEDLYSLSEGGSSPSGGEPDAEAEPEKKAGRKAGGRKRDL